MVIPRMVVFLKYNRNLPVYNKENNCGVFASPVSPVHSTHSASMPVLAQPSMPGLTQIPTFVPNTLPLLTSGLGHLYTGSEEFLYENMTNPVSSTTNSKKRKLPESPKIPRTHQNGNGVQVKIEPSIQSPDPTTTVLPSSDDDYNFELSAAEANALFVDSSFQCIRFQSFQPNTWAQLLDKDMKEIASPNFRVDADKGFNYSNADESFVCQKKNHFQVTVHVQPVAEAHYVRTLKGPESSKKGNFPTRRSKWKIPTNKRPFHPVPLELVTDQVTKTTVGRLHFSETTSNNMRKKGKPNPDQRFFFLVVSLCAHVSGEPPITIIAHSSEKIIVRASNPGQFENDMELSWQKGHTLDSIFHNVSEKIVFRYS
ncbi:myelin regulatory factor [Trichonephila inaurata madagascariensis]|uniref:Myelin regulatory factor n=1 Tax=Trichonephila inaurata madagascariensis TaxID=2747483 RepID=A0A8X6WWB0_9ARAC|nr:myelin regulatory factor [Trichonephila inaurata madagascariensis]